MSLPSRLSPMPSARVAGRPFGSRHGPRPIVRLAVAMLAIGGGMRAAADEHALLTGMQPLELDRPLDEVMVEGIDRFLLDRTARSAATRDAIPAGTDDSDRVAKSRERLREITGAVDPRRVPEDDSESFERYGSAAVVESPDGLTIRITRARIDVLDGVTADGLLLEPSTPARAFVVALGDATWTPEQFVGIDPGVPDSARLPIRLAESSITVFVPTMIDRTTRHSGNPVVGFTNQSHREFLFRTGFEVGRHPIGYEIQRTLAVIDRLARAAGSDGRIGVVGVGEGGIVALCAAALDERIDSTLVSGSFGPAEESWRQPIDRSLWRRLEAHGDAELAALVAPRRLVVEAAAVPSFTSPPPTSGRSTSAPGRIETLPLQVVRAEFARAIRAVRSSGTEPESSLRLAESDGGEGTPGCDTAWSSFLEGLAIPNGSPRATGSFTVMAAPCHERRQERQFRELLEHTQRRMQLCWRDREHLWADFDASSAASRESSVTRYREIVRDGFIGRLDVAQRPLAARCRRLSEAEGFTTWEITCEVNADIVAGGLLLVPKDIPPGDRRAVVVCQHGLEGRPIDTVAGPDDPAWQAYRGFAAALVGQGYVVLAPQNPYRGGDRFRTLQRKAWPLGLSLFAVIVAQHERLIDLLETLPFVDASRVGFYGLSYGGKTAMRVPALVPRYALSICSGDFNQWVRKVASIERSTCYPFHGEYEITEWNMGGVADYAELAWLIAPRPFMVERGRRDGCAPDEWVAAEFARVQPVYERLGLADRAAIEWFDGPHTIHGEGTFAFLARHLPPTVTPSPTGRPGVATER